MSSTMYKYSLIVENFSVHYNFFYKFSWLIVLGLNEIKISLSLYFCLGDNLWDFDAVSTHNESVFATKMINWSLLCLPFFSFYKNW